jgi:LPXTG-site transpeptidase (sortase) family protein
VRHVRILAIALGLLVVSAGIAIVLSSPREKGVVPAPTGVQATPVAIVERLPAPATATPLPNASGIAANRIKIPELSIDLEVVPGDGVNAPLYKAAEYPEPMKLPGQGGRSMIYAHARTGMFGPLFNGKIGQHVDVTLADGKQLHYTIKEYYSHWPVDDLRWFQQSDHEQLILVTCTTYNPNDPRIVAVAEPS